jgi:hypothetical protein
VGPLAWLAQLPFMQGVPGGMGGQIAGVAARVVAAATIFAGATAPVAASGAPSTGGAPPLVRQSTPDTTVALPSASAPEAVPPPTPDSTTTTTVAPAVTPTTVAAPAAGAPAAVAAPSTTAPKPSVASPPAPKPTTPTTKPPAVAPTAQADKGETKKQNPIDIDVTHNDSANTPGGFVYPITILDTPGSANVSVQADGHTVHYVPNNQAKGEYEFHYQVCNTTGGCATGTVTVRVG